MADRFQAPGLARFNKVQKASVPPKGKRDAAGGIVYPTGTVDVNVAGTALVDGEAKVLGIDPKELRVAYGADEAKEQVAILVCRPGGDDAGLIDVRRDTKHKTITLYLHSVFEQYPKLRPEQPRWCPFTQEPDGAGGHYIQINLNGALPTAPTRHRKAAKTQPESP